MITTTPKLAALLVTLGALLLALLPIAAQAQEEPPPPGPQEPTRLFVVLFDEGVEASSLEASNAMARGSEPVTVVSTLETLPVAVVLTTDAGSLELAAQPGVVAVSEDTGGVGAVADARQLIGADGHHVDGNLGAGVTVAVLDTGIDLTHPDLLSSIQAGSSACFGDRGNGTSFCPGGQPVELGPTAVLDDAGHGTYMSGIIASDGVVAPAGVAPGVTVVPFKVMDNCTFAGCFYSTALNILPALDYLIANPQLGVDVVNMSFSTNARFPGDCDAETSWTQALSLAVEQLRSQGVVLLAASGNNGSTTSMSAPACLRNVISVGASTDAGDRSGYSNVSPTTDVFAPGDSVIASVLGGGATQQSGTSGATAVVTGCAALKAAEFATTTARRLETRLLELSTPNASGSLDLVCNPVARCDGRVATIDMNQPGTTGVGTPGRDVIVGTPGADTIDGAGGDDVICGGGGDDQIDAGDGNDLVFGDDGDDQIDGGEGDDRLHGGDDDDQIDAGAGSDLVRGDGGADDLAGGDEADRLYGGDGDDHIDGDAGPDRLFGGGDQDTLRGGPDDDALYGNGQLDDLSGGPGNDLLAGGGGRDVLSGGSGADTARGGSGPDTLTGGDGDDVLAGNDGDDELAGNGGIDTCRGNDHDTSDVATSSCEHIASVP